MATYMTPYGPIYYDNSGNDHRPNIIDYKPVFPKRHEFLKLQQAALKAFQEAERRYGHKLHPKHLPRRSLAIQVTGSWRSFDLQNSLWRSDPARFASPYTSGHVQGIAFDLSTTNPRFDLQRSIFLNIGWKQARPSDEPWHFSFGVTV